MSGYAALASTWPGQTLVMVNRDGSRMVTLEVWHKNPQAGEQWLRGLDRRQARQRSLATPVASPLHCYQVYRYRR